MKPVPVDSCEILVLVDNVSDILSSVPRGVTGEIANVFRAGADTLSGRCLCCAQWGLSLVVTARTGDTARRLLFDTGPEGYGVERNGDRLGVDFGEIDAVVFSHGHWDHVGGMLTALDLITGANGGRPVPVHVNDGMFVDRAVRRPDGGVIPFEAVPTKAELAAAGASLVVDDGPRLIGDGMFCISGEIPRVTAYEQGLPGHVRRSPEGGWVDDPLILDERFVAIHVRDKGMVVLTACSHAGVVNVLTHARDLFAPVPIHAVVGGFHLSGAACEAVIPETVEDMRAFDLAMMVPGHCTGWRAVHRLVSVFGEERVVPSAVGRRHVF
jgi:7,8-dihydropterin-6-yl-methyl-4-(beta-D-ribofuranosyl)aminobenzene 5'-phosphate synthase